MSNKTQLQTNNTQLASLISTLQGKAAGGGGASLDPCTVTLKALYGIYIKFYAATVVNDGMAEAVFVSQPNSTDVEIVLENVLCNSMLMLATSASGFGASVEGGVTDLGTFAYYSEVFRAPETAGASGVATLYNNV